MASSARELRSGAWNFLPCTWDAPQTSPLAVHEIDDDNHHSFSQMHAKLRLALRASVRAPWATPCLATSSRHAEAICAGKPVQDLVPCGVKWACTCAGKGGTCCTHVEQFRWSCFAGLFTVVTLVLLNSSAMPEKACHGMSHCVALGTWQSMKGSPSLFRTLPPYPRRSPDKTQPTRGTPPGWHCTDCRPWSGSPCRGASVGIRARVIAPTMTTRGECRRVSSEAVHGTFLHAHGDASQTFLLGIQQSNFNPMP